MKQNNLVESSRRFYARLINLYPKAHVAEYGEAMVQVFTDQCREAFQKQGFLGLLILWIRTMIDLGKTAVYEHLQTRSSKIGLPEISPLPWKDVLLVLIPGLVILIIYAVMLVDKYYYLSLDPVIEWLAYLSAVPILLIWWRTKTFPVWGLVPAGLILYYVYRLITSIPFLLKGFYPSSWLLITTLLIVLLVSLGLRYARLWGVSRTAYLWLGICVFADLIQLGLMLFYNLKLSNWNWSSLVSETSLNVYPSPSVAVMEIIVFLLFIIITTFFARKYGDLSVLFLLGFIFITNLYYVPVGKQSIIYTLAIAFRMLVTLVLPLWVVRASSARGRHLGIAIPIVFAILAQVALEWGTQTGWFFEGARAQYIALAQYPALLVAYSIFRATSIAAGFILAMVLCRAARSQLPGSLDQAGIAQKTVQI
ncbi:MAG TPA: hypothetical protein VF359_02300 [Anaerolineales bacterium]